MLFAEVMCYTIELGLLTSMEGEWLMLMMKNLLIGDWTSLVVDMPDSHDHGVWWVLSSLETRMHPATFLSITGMNTGLHGTSMWPYGTSHRVFVIVKLNPHLWRWRWWCHWKNGNFFLSTSQPAYGASERCKIVVPSPSHLPSGVVAMCGDSVASGLLAAAHAHDPW